MLSWLTFVQHKELDIRNDYFHVSFGDTMTEASEHN